MEAMDWTLPAGLVLLLLLFVYLYGTWTFLIFKDFGIPGPKPVPFFGNMLEIWKKGLSSCILEWNKKYGKNFIIYIMREPLHVTSDLDIAKEVLIKDFNNFVNRSTVPRRIIHSRSKNNVAEAEDNTWRRLRHTLTPNFSPGKLKQMSPHILRCCENLSRVIEKETEKAQLIDVRRVVGAFSIDVIAGTGFGLETDFIANDNDPFLQVAIAALRGGTSLGWSSALINDTGRMGFICNSRTPATNGGYITSLHALFPWLSGVVQLLKDNLSNNTVKMYDFIIQLIEERKTNREASRVDLLQLMLDAEATEADIAARPQDKQMTRNEIIAQSVTFLLAGNDATANTLQFMTYLLALNPDKQEKLYNEIVSSIGDASPDYEDVMNIKYLDNIIWETTRCFPFAALIGRKAAETRTIKGVTIKAKTCVAVSISGIMHDEEIFHEPHRFIPERFDNNDIPVVLRELPFGAGPRRCIGMRLALYQIKMAAVTIIRRFKFTKVPETPELITFNTSTLFSTPLKPVLVGAERRK